MPRVPLQKPASRGPKTAQNRRRKSSKKRSLPSGDRLWGITCRGAKGALPGLLVVGSIAVGVGACVLGYQWLTESERFEISEFEIQGHQHLSRNQVISSLDLGDKPNLFRTDMGSLEERLVANPWIAKAEVTRTFPDTIEVEIVEQEATAVVELDGLYLINEAAQPFKRVSVDEDLLDGLTIITGLDRESFLASPERHQESLQYALLALVAYRDNSKRPRIGEVHLDPRHGLTLITYEDAIAIHLGSPPHEELSNRFHTFDSAWQALDVEEHQAARAFRIVDRTPSDQVTIAFAGN